MEVSSEIIDKIKNYQKEIIIEVDRICRANNLKYYLAYGTLIGAIRHDGFIPWDDDIDIMMPYEDMIKLQTICESQLDKSRFFYQSPQTENEYRLSINRIRRNGTVLLEKNLEDKNVHKGIFVDIYPLYGADEDDKKRKNQVKNCMLYCLYLLGEPVKNHGLIMKLGSSFLLFIKGKKGQEKASQKYFEKMNYIDYDSAKYVADYSSELKSMRTAYKKEWFGNGIPHKFEDLTLMIPENSDEILRKFYGDYMVIPPQEQQVFHHDYTKIEV